MKGVLRTGGVVLAAAGLVVVGRSWSGPPAKPAPPKSRIALVNMAYVFKHSEKWQRNQAELKETFEQYEKRAKELGAEAEEIAKAVKGPDLPAETREQAGERLPKLKKEAEDHNAAAKRELGEMSDKHMVAIYKDIQQASERYAKDNDLDAVYMYTEAVDEKDWFNPKNIIAKLQNRACFPLYKIPGLDVSKEIVAAMNAKKGWQVAPPAPAEK